MRHLPDGLYLFESQLVFLAIKVVNTYLASARLCEEVINFPAEPKS